ncbi:signal peptidase II [Asticcacaulis sp. BYS171W]|uniref:Lipoprotein signal peptidase n=1 Tax=Asticcacaulis aquaticus TaxID=2984212 RepID=A0ABT5HV12_9CAUL|nr:signal peptidase II [Asticcacaulis aquaticus]MDC7683910.1 signal peptidase II [Asticcacaulis aquaticus]
MSDFQTKLKAHFAPPHTTPLGRRVLWLSLIALILDQASKIWILYGLQLPSLQQVKIWPFFSFSMVWNNGVSFGFLSSDGIGRWLLVLFSLGVAVCLLDWVRRAERRVLAIGLALVAGGAIGNAIDRIAYGAVVDFLDFSGLGFKWVFNVADAAINVGVALLFIDVFFLNKEDRKQG